MAPAISIHKKDVILVKPADFTPSEVLSLYTLDNDQVVELLYQTVYVYKANNITNLDPTLIIKEALSKILVYYYPLAGKLKWENNEKLILTCNEDGVPFLEAYANCQLSSLHYLDGIDSETANLLSFDWPSESEYGYHPLVMRVTKFSCGGFTITMGLSHSICDGSGSAQFYKALIELASGKSEPTVKPVWERERLVGKPNKDPILPPIDMSLLAKSPFFPCTSVAHESFYVTGEAIERLKMSLSRELKEKEMENFTTVEILGAYVWRSRSRALQLSADVLTMRDLEEFPLFKVAKMIKESKRVLTSTDFVQKMLDKKETMMQNKVPLEISKGTSCLELTDWRHIGLLESVDFGWKEIVNFIPLAWSNCFIDLCILSPPCKINSSMKGKGGLRVLVTLPEAAMTKMKEEMENLNHHGGYHIDI